ncbi:hypothetical protein EOM82_09940, partial [bacterium]|nr:hypothetical protein [bacterium]
MTKQYYGIANVALATENVLIYVYNIPDERKEVCLHMNIKMKKYISLLLAIITVLFTFAFAGCSKKEETTENVTIKVAGLKGPTSMGLVKLMEDDANKTTKNDYEFTVAGTADEITPKLIQGDFD